MRSLEDIHVVQPGRGDSVELGGIGADFKLDGEVTLGSYSIVEHPLAPGALVPPHAHANEDEAMYVIVGEIGARVGDTVLPEASAGTYIFKPRGIPHTFWNAGAVPARIMHILSPSGFETYFRELAALIPARGEPDFEAITELAERYGVTFRLDWVPELSQRYKVSVYGR